MNTNVCPSVAMEGTSRRVITTISGQHLELFLGIGVAVIGLLEVWLLVLGHNALEAVLSFDG